MSSIAAGAAIFVAAGAALPFADADSARLSPSPLPARSLAPGSGSPAVTARAEAGRISRRAAHSLARADRAAISELAANGIPSVALNAYRVAAARMDNVEPGCRIDWSLIAGIGRIESDHGRFAGAVLHADGISTPSIIGPALDGRQSDYIAAPANGRQLDGDPTYAHALGPMQFIPSTWAVYGADETGDGKADIFNINDAALGTARYLCAAGGDLGTQAGKVRAVLTYNHSDVYLAQVLALADAYHRGLRVSGIPVVGVTKRGLPRVVDTGFVPPANPGGPKTGGAATAPATRSTSPSRSVRPSPTAPTSATSSTPAGPKPTRPPSSTASARPPRPTPACGLVQRLLHRC